MNKTYPKDWINNNKQLCACRDLLRKTLKLLWIKAGRFSDESNILFWTFVLNWGRLLESVCLNCVEIGHIPSAMGSTAGFLTPWQKYKNVKAKILSKTAREKWLFARSFVTFFFRITFCPITDPNFRVRWTTWFCAFIYAYQCSLAIFTIYEYRDDWLVCIQCWCYCGVIPSVSA